jgi:hypothetical protein
MRSLAIALMVLATTPVEAKACHLYSRWHYPWRQSCGVPTRSPLHVRHEAPFVAPLPPEADIPLPSLARADCDGGEADEATRGRLLLRAALEAPDAH